MAEATANAAAITDVKDLNNHEKAALLFLCMDEKSSENLFTHLQDEEIQKVGSALMKLRQVPPGQIRSTIREFLKGFIDPTLNLNGGLSLRGMSQFDGKKLMDRLFNRSLPRRRSENIMTSLSGPVVRKKDPGKQTAMNVELQNFLDDQNPEVLFEVLQEEHPQLTALALAHMRKALAKDVVSRFPPEAQINLVGRTARLSQATGQALDDLRSILQTKVQEKKKQMGDGGDSKSAMTKPIPIEGISVTVKMLKALGREKANKIVEEIERTDPQVAEQISRLLFTIEDLERADDAGIRELLRGISNEDMKASLKDAPDPIKEKFFKNMSERAAMILREDMSVMAPLKVEEIEAAQTNILKVAKDLMKEGKLTLAEIPEKEE